MHCTHALSHACQWSTDGVNGKLFNNDVPNIPQAPRSQKYCIQVRWLSSRDNK